MKQALQYSLPETQNILKHLNNNFVRNIWDVFVAFHFHMFYLKPDTDALVFAYKTCTKGNDLSYYGCCHMCTKIYLNVRWLYHDILAIIS